MPHYGHHTHPHKHLVTTNAPATERMRMLDDEKHHPAVDSSWSMQLPNQRVWKHKGLSDIKSAQHYGALQPIAITNSAGQTKSTPFFPEGTHNPTGSPS